MNKQLIERYECCVIDGKGYIRDRLKGYDVVKFNFPITKNDLARELCEICEQYLEEHEK